MVKVGFWLKETTLTVERRWTVNKQSSPVVLCKRPFRHRFYGSEFAGSLEKQKHGGKWQPQAQLALLWYRIEKTANSHM